MEGKNIERQEKIKLLKKEVVYLTCFGYKKVQKVLPFITYDEEYPNRYICLEFKDKQHGKHSITIGTTISVEVAVELGILKPLINN